MSRPHNERDGRAKRLAQVDRWLRRSLHLTQEGFKHAEAEEIAARECGSSAGLLRTWALRLAGAACKIADSENLKTEN
jgi:hypothetical protein